MFFRGVGQPPTRCSCDIVGHSFYRMHKRQYEIVLLSQTWSLCLGSCGKTLIKHETLGCPIGRQSQFFAAWWGKWQNGCWQGMTRVEIENKHALFDIVWPLVVLDSKIMCHSQHHYHRLLDFHMVGQQIPKSVIPPELHGYVWKKTILN